MTRWRLLGSERLLDSPWLTVDRNSYALPDGRVIPDYYVSERRDFVIVVAYSPTDDDLLLVRQYRPTEDGPRLALPAGFIDAGEEPEAAARRGLLEETGYVALTIRPLGVLRPLPGYLRCAGHVFLVERSAEPVAVFDGTEIDEVVRLPFNEALAMIRSGALDEMETVAAVLLAQDALDWRGRR